MFRIEYLKLGLGTVILRFYLLMLIVIVAGFSGLPALGLLALPLFLSTVLGVTVKFGKEKKKIKIKEISKKEELQAA